METLLKPHKNPSVCHLSRFCGPFTDDNSEALRAVKLDPAVLDAQVAVGDGSQCTVAKAVRTKECSQSSNFQVMLMHQEAALLSLTPSQFDLLMKFTETLRQQRQTIQKQLECAFCKNNGESVSWYSTHSLKDSRGRVRCPVLRCYRCSLCGAVGDHAHTIKYCPKNTLDRSRRRLSSSF